MYATLDSMTFSGKKVILRADLNVPFKDGKITDEDRINRIIPTLKELIQKGARVLILSHLGRPKGQEDPALSLDIVFGKLKEKLPGTSCAFTSLEKASQSIALVTLVENIRFFPGEEKNDPVFAEMLASLGDVFVNDAFSVSHRAHASTEGITHFIPSLAGRLMETELNALESTLDTPKTPVMAIVGGAKVSTKLHVLENLLHKVDMLVIGGAMANTFLAAGNHSVGKSLCEPELFDTAKRIMAKADKHTCEIILPLDVIVAKEITSTAAHREAFLNDVQEDDMILDIGSLSRDHIIEKMAQCRTLLWNGPLGVFEVPPFDLGTNQVAQSAQKLTHLGYITSVAGGGDTISALKHAGVLKGFSYVSTAGGAFLEWLEGKELPGVDALKKHANVP